MAVAITWRPRTPPGPAPSTLTWIADAHQLGPVGYRDPAGAISPDGKWIAYSEGRFLRVRPIEGGPILDLPAGDAQIRNLTWHPNSQLILTDGFPDGGWGLYDIAARTRQRVWADRTDLRHAAWSPTGQVAAAVINAVDGAQVVTLTIDGRTTLQSKSGRPISFPTWTPRGEIACIASVDRRARVTLPCGGTPIEIQPDADAYGPMAFSADGNTLFVALANRSGTVDLWSVPVTGGRGRRLTAFSRDAYAPSVAPDGSVVFKVQSYRTSVAIAPAEGGPTRPLATFQSETPSWDPTGLLLGITYGTWRRLPDDAHYPDIDQNVGIIGVDADHPAATPARVVHNSISEDQSLCWSPNAKWIAFHSHRDQSDDIWLRAADEAHDTAKDVRRISFLGRGAETGWPRWSPDGRRLLFDGTDRRTGRPSMYVVGLDQDTGAVTEQVRAIPTPGIGGDVTHGEWLPDSRRIVAVAKERPGEHVILMTDLEGGAATVIRRFASEHDTPGLGVSPDGKNVAFIAPAQDGVFQVWRLALDGGAPTQVTTDPSNKTQPAWSPDGRSIAFTVWSYDAQFWRLAQ